MRNYYDVAGLEQAIKRILERHVGRNEAIRRKSLLRLLANASYQVTDRVMRAQINQLRKDGVLICSAGGENGGYWLAESPEELEEFIEHELHPRAMDFLEQEKALKLEAARRWGEGKQLILDF